MKNRVYLLMISALAFVKVCNGSFIFNFESEEPVRDREWMYDLERLEQERQQRQALKKNQAVVKNVKVQQSAQAEPQDDAVDLETINLGLGSSCNNRPCVPRPFLADTYQLNSIVPVVQKEKKAEAVPQEKRATCASCWNGCIDRIISCILGCRCKEDDQ